MKQLVVLSGKGGTGKTTITGALIKLAENKGFADCDVDAPNLQLICSKLQYSKKEDFYALKKAVKYNDECINCGKCEELCRFGAIKDGKVNINDCEGCGVCEYFCPVREKIGVSAIRLEDNVSGYTYLSKIDGEMFSHAELIMGNGASGLLVTEVRKRLRNNISNEELLIIDGSPGIGCPVIASITGVDMVLAVTEPTLSGLHDLKRIIETAKRFEAECMVCINKYDINENITTEIEKYCEQEKIYNAGRVPYDPTVSKAINNNKSIIDYPDSSACEAIKQIWEIVKEKLLN